MWELSGAAFTLLMGKAHDGAEGVAGKLHYFNILHNEWIDLYAHIKDERFVTVREAKHAGDIVVRNFEQQSIYDRIAQSGIK